MLLHKEAAISPHASKPNTLMLATGTKQWLLKNQSSDELPKKNFSHHEDNDYNRQLTLGKGGGSQLQVLVKLLDDHVHDEGRQRV